MLLACRTFVNKHTYRGNKPDVVLIHGTGGDATLWRPQIHLLTQKGYRCIVPDLRGHGRSPDPEEPCNLNVHLQDLLETLEKTGVTFPAVFVGHSLGAMISVALAESHPELVTHVLSVSMPARVPKVTSGFFRWFLRWPYEKIKDTVIHRNLPRRYRLLVKTELHSLREIATNFATVDYIGSGIDAKRPIHFSVGRFDVVAPFLYVEQMHRALPNSTFHLFRWSGHSCMDDEPKEFNKWFMSRIGDWHLGD